MVGVSDDPYLPTPYLRGHPARGVATSATCFRRSTPSGAATLTSCCFRTNPVGHKARSKTAESQARGRMPPNWTSTFPPSALPFHPRPLHGALTVRAVPRSTAPRCTRPEGGDRPGSSAPSAYRTDRATARAVLRRPGDPCSGRSERSSDPSRPRARRSHRAARARRLPRPAGRWRSEARHPRFHASQETLASFYSSVSQGGDTAIRVHRSCSDLIRFHPGTQVASGGVDPGWMTRALRLAQARRSSVSPDPRLAIKGPGGFAKRGRSDYLIGSHASIPNRSCSWFVCPPAAPRLCAASPS